MKITSKNQNQAIAALRKCAMENSNKQTDTGCIRIADLCNDVADYLETLPKTISEDIEYTRTDAFMLKAKKAFCKASCNGHPPRSTCTSLGTCREYDNFVKYMKEETK